VPKAAECDGGVSDVGTVREHDLENANVSNDRRGDGGDEEEDGCEEDEGHTDPVPMSNVSCASATDGLGDSQRTSEVRDP
jgi:hypothetical protein